MNPDYTGYVTDNTDTNESLLLRHVTDNPDTNES